MCWLIKWRSEQISAARWKSVKFARLHFLFVNWDWISQGLAQYDCMCRYYKANTKYQRISTCRMMLLEPCRISVLRRYFTKESSVPSRVSAYWKSRYVGGKTTFRTPGCTGCKKWFRRKNVNLATSLEWKRQVFFETNIFCVFKLVKTYWQRLFSLDFVSKCNYSDQIRDQ